MNKLFVYGTLLNDSIQQYILGRKIEGQESVLVGFKQGNWASYLRIEEGEGTVEGKVLEISDTELARADVYEGNAYRRVKAKTESGEEVWVYSQ